MTKHITIAPQQEEKEDQKYENVKHKNNNIKKLGIALATLGAIGLMYLLKENNKDDLGKKFHKGRKELQQDLWNIFGEVSEELENEYKNLRNGIFDELSYIQERALLNQKKYEALINQAVDNFAKDKNWPEYSLDMLKQGLKSEWEKIEKFFQDSQSAEK